MTRSLRPRHTAGDDDHKRWLGLLEVGGPFLSVPVLRQTWPTLDALDEPQRERLRARHAAWLDDPAGVRDAWIGYVLADLLEWGDARHTSGLGGLAVEVPEHETVLTADFAVVQPGEEPKPDAVRVIGLVLPAGSRPTARIAGSTWAATPADRVAHLCRHHGIELGLVTDGRFWTLVWAPRGGATATATFDTIAWAEAAERDVVRAFRSLLCRSRFFGVPDEERLVPLLRNSLDNQEEITEALGVRVRQAVELLVGAFGRIDVDDRRLGGRGLRDVDAQEVYRGAVSIMMRIVFLLFAEERGLLPADNELYAATYSAGRLCAELEERATEGGEEDLEHSTAAWRRLIALFTAVFSGVDHPRLTMHAHGGSLFDASRMAWLPLNVDDRTVLHMLRAVRHVRIGRGAKTSERRTVSFRTLDVEQIGYVYEGLLSYEGFRAGDVTVGLIGKEGIEEEVRLTDLEHLATRHPGASALAAAIAAARKDSKIGSAAAVTKRLAVLDGPEREEARTNLLAVTGGDYPLSERLLPFYGIIRTDLRGLPVVVLPGAPFVTESALRSDTGTHYTPRKLAEEVVEGALEPLVYEPGPLQTADTGRWRPKSTAEILDLKVADIAMGSAAFLVAAARYLGRHLLDAALREDLEWARSYRSASDTTAPDAEDDPAVIEARRRIIRHCLYGVDINPMAVEMAKLSLWLVSMDPRLPFTFLDDRLTAGDSLLGITSLDQLEFMHLDPARGRALHEGAPFAWTRGIRSLVTEVAKERRHIAALERDGDEMVAPARKRELLRQAERKTERLRLLADVIVGASLANAAKGAAGLDSASVRAAGLAEEVAAGRLGEASESGVAWLDTDRVEGAFERRPVNWPLIFPEVFESGGFDAVVGNPPFLGGSKLSSVNGHSYREYLLHALSESSRGKVDLIAYFLLRGVAVLRTGGQLAFVATNTLAQGDTAEAGLARLVQQGNDIRRAVSGAPWPSKSADLQYCVVWMSKSRLDGSVRRVLDGEVVAGITPFLGVAGRVSGTAARLPANKGVALLGSKVRGVDAFTLSPEEAHDLVRADESYRDVLLPFLTGRDLNGVPGSRASRWIINFHDWDAERAATYPRCFDLVRSRLPARAGRWWQYEHRAPTLYRAIQGRERVFAMAEVSSTGMPVAVPASQVFSHKVVVFTRDDPGFLALLSSSVHGLWSTRPGTGTMRTDPSYTPSDAFETFALPEVTPELRDLGSRLDEYRHRLMLTRRSGLTATYNLVFDPRCADDDIARLRSIHRDIDEAVCAAYGWADLVEQRLEHGFHQRGSYTRYVPGPAAQREILDRLLELNLARSAEPGAGTRTSLAR